MHTIGEQYAKLIDALRRREEVLGVWLGGSRGKGYHDEHSDYDLLIVVRDAAVMPQVKTHIASLALNNAIDVGVTTLGALRDLARWGRSDAWRRYAFADTRVIFDRTGEVQTHIDRIGRLPERYRRSLTRRALDAYLNATYRAVKAQSRGKGFAARLDSGHAVEHLLVALFALHGRFKPYNDYLEREIWHLHLLGQLQGGLLERFSALMLTAELKAHFNLRDDMDTLFRAHGFGEVFDSWADHWQRVAHEFASTVSTYNGGPQQ
jgi:predicted nucleotidyltransferase